MKRITQPTLIGGLIALIASCAAAESGERPPVYTDTSGSLCSFVALESSSAPQHETLDASSLIAVFRLREPGLPAPRDPITLKFLVERSRVDELRGRLEAQPEVICRPDSDARYRVELRGFDEFAPQQP